MSELVSQARTLRSCEGLVVQRYTFEKTVSVFILYVHPGFVLNNRKIYTFDEYSYGPNGYRSSATDHKTSSSDSEDQVADSMANQLHRLLNWARGV